MKIETRKGDDRRSNRFRGLEEGPDPQTYLEGASKVREETALSVQS